MTRPLDQVPLERLKTRTSIKWRYAAQDVLPLWVAEMDVDLAPAIAEALGTALAASDTGYPGSVPFVESFTAFAARRWGWDVPTGSTRAVAGVIQGYTDALLAAAGPSGTVVITSPVYPPFTTYLRQAGLTVVEAPLTTAMRLDAAAIDSALGQALASGAPGAAVLLCNPHNPGGTLHTREELESLAAVAAKHRATVVSDEIHAPLVYSPGVFVPYLTVDANGVALHAASKAWNLAALPAAIMVFGTEAVEIKRAIMSGAHHWPSHWGAIAGEAAYRAGGDWLDALVEDLDHRRHYLADLVKRQLPGVQMQLPEATYLAWLDMRSIDLGGDPATVLLDKAKVELNSGPTFGHGGEGHVRLNFATRTEVLDQAVERIASAIY